MFSVSVYIRECAMLSIIHVTSYKNKVSTKYDCIVNGEICGFPQEIISFVFP